MKFKGCLINCGNGSDEHPTQSLIDIYTIYQHFQKIDGLSISIIGDLKNMRTAHSLVLILSKFSNNKINLISPNLLKIPAGYINNPPESIILSETDKFNLEESDVIYMTGFPPNKHLSENIRLSYNLNLEKIRNLKKNSIILNPLPRIDEISREVDESPHTKYFEQSKKGLYVRMAILLSLFND